jgi:hypothetical protein
VYAGTADDRRASCADPGSGKFNRLVSQRRRVARQCTITGRRRGRPGG